MNRRTLLTNLAVAAPAAALLGASLKSALAEGGAAGAAKPELKLVPDSDPTAKALKYVHDGAKATRPDKAGVAGKDQVCKGCQFYTKTGELEGKEVGKCLMIAGGMVASQGWCVSWTKRA